jgi:ferredoxin-thioredoxin reductase catalytic subunit
MKMSGYDEDVTHRSCTSAGSDTQSKRWSEKSLEVDLRSLYQLTRLGIERDPGRIVTRNRAGAHDSICPGIEDPEIVEYESL